MNRSGEKRWRLHALRPEYATRLHVIVVSGWNSSERSLPRDLCPYFYDLCVGLLKTTLQMFTSLVTAAADDPDQSRRDLPPHLRLSERDRRNEP